MRRVGVASSAKWEMRRAMVASSEIRRVVAGNSASWEMRRVMVTSS